jgi:hypothetical protein
MKTSKFTLLVVLTLPWLTALSARAQDSQTMTFTLTGQQPGPFNIGAKISGKKQTVPMTNGATTADADKPTAMFAKSSFPFFPDESHHHGNESHHKPKAGATPKPPFVPNVLNPLQPYTNSPPLGFPPFADPLPFDYVCHNYVWEQLTGVKSSGSKTPADIAQALGNLNFNPQTFKPGQSLPPKFPPGTVLQYADHVGIVGSDGTTIFNYTKPNNDYGLPAKLNMSPNANDLWKSSFTPKPTPAPGLIDRLVGGDTPVQPGTSTPYANSPVSVWEPPQQ